MDTQPPSGCHGGKMWEKVQTPLVRAVEEQGAQRATFQEGEGNFQRRH
jgi:hypothetical protein